MTRQRRHQRGQALIEAAFAIPIMVLMVFGTFYITYAYMQRSIMNGAAFMAARAVSVRTPGESGSLAKKVVVRMAENAKLGGDHWLLRAPVAASQAAGVHLEEPDGMWSFLARMSDTAAGGSSKKQQVNIRLAPEFREISAEGRAPQSYRVISYTVDDDGYTSGLKLVATLLDMKPEDRISEPDHIAIDPTHTTGGVDSLGGTVYQRNTAKLGHHKWQIGLRATAPEQNDEKIEPDDQFLPATNAKGHLARLRAIGVIFDEVVLMQKGINVLTEELGFVKGLVGELYQPLADERDVIIGKGLQYIQEQQTLTLSPGAGH